MPMLERPTASAAPASLGPAGHDAAPAGASPLAEALPPAPCCHKLFERLVQTGREAGAFVSGKLKYDAPPPEQVPGLIATAKVATLEQLVRIPQHLQVTYELVAEQAPEVIKASRILRRATRIECPEVVAFVSQQLQRLEPWAAEDDAWASADWFEAYYGMQMGVSFGNMPHRFLLGEEGARLFAPSPEAHNAEWNDAALRAAHEAALQSVKGPAPRPSLRRFVQAYLLLLTRTFGGRQEEGAGGGAFASTHVVVPLADSLNHSADPNATWGFGEQGDFVVKASRPIEPGEEVFISYGGEKSNVRLLRTYGFTLHPSLEPGCSFRAWPSLAGGIFERHLPERLQGKVLDMETKKVDGAVAAVLCSCDAPRDFLRELCGHFLALYEADASLEAPLGRLREERAVRPASHVWWPAAEEEHPPDELAWLSQCALRVKMSEYLCLRAHLEALDVLQGVLPEEQCLDHGRTLLEPLREALDPEDGDMASL